MKEPSLEDDRKLMMKDVLLTVCSGFLVLIISVLCMVFALRFKAQHKSGPASVLVLLTLCSVMLFIAWTFVSKIKFFCIPVRTTVIVYVVLMKLHFVLRPMTTTCTYIYMSRLYDMAGLKINIARYVSRYWSLCYTASYHGPIHVIDMLISYSC